MSTDNHIVYYLDNTDISIIEIENEVAGLLDIAWLIYYKSSGITQFFTFRRAGAARIQQRYGKPGYFRGSGSDRKLYIEIDRQVVPFKEKKTEKMPRNVREHITAYLNNGLI
jgi:hypothetical protein